MIQRGAIALTPRWGLMFGRRPMLVAGIALVGLFVALALFAPVVAPYDPILQDPQARLQPPSLAHLFGTDNFGATCCRAWSGARASTS